jgi:cob(I)alamin adenosyltransferase
MHRAAGKHAEDFLRLRAIVRWRVLTADRQLGHRLSKIYTRTGDSGTTGLASSERVPKTDVRIEAIGSVDETNCLIGLVLAEDFADTRLRQVLVRLQNELFDVGAELASPGIELVTDEHVQRLEADLDVLNEDLPPLKEFVLPGGSRAAACCHLARAFARRSERTAWQLADRAEVGAALLRYLNRLSDLLFVTARYLARQGGRSESLWESPSRPSH